MVNPDPSQWSVAEAWARPWPAPLQTKVNHLLRLLQDAAPLTIAFSGGQDSAFLLAASVLAHASKKLSTPLALTISSPLLPSEDLIFARRLCKRLSAEHRERPVNPLDLPNVRHNAADRCYHCKRHLFSILLEEARKAGARLADGTHAGDRPEERPGMRALEELHVFSPLREAGLFEAEIKEGLRHLGLTDWARPPSSCLATRFPYNEELTPERLHTADLAEKSLHAMGFPVCRVRMTGPTARIEVPPEDINRLTQPEQWLRIKELFNGFGLSLS